MKLNHQQDKESINSQNQTSSELNGLDSNYNNSNNNISSHNVNYSGSKKHAKKDMANYFESEGNIIIVMLTYHNIYRILLSY